MSPSAFRKPLKVPPINVPRYGSTSDVFADHSAIRIAVVGIGRWGPNQVRNFHQHLGCDVVAVDRDIQRLKCISEMFPRVTCETDLAVVLKDPTILAIVVATPTVSHYALVREALLHDKHVLCEKPLCRLSREAQELLALAEGRQLKLMTGHTFLFNPGINKIKSLIDQGELGDLQYLAAVRTNLGPIRCDVNVALDLASHDIAVFNWLLNSEPIRVSAIGGHYVQPEIHDVVFINLVYPGRQVANIHASWIDPKKVRQMTIVGSQRMVTWDDLRPTTSVAIYDRGAQAQMTTGDFGEFLRVTMWDGDIRLPRIEPTEPLKIQARAFLDAIFNSHPHLSDGAFSLGVVRVLEAVEQSLDCSGQPIEMVAQPPSHAVFAEVPQ